MCRVICCPGGPISMKHIHLETENSSLKEVGRDERQFHKVFNDAMDDAVNYLDLYFWI